MDVVRLHARGGLSDPSAKIEFIAPGDATPQDSWFMVQFPFRRRLVPAVVFRPAEKGRSRLSLSFLRLGTELPPTAEIIKDADKRFRVLMAEAKRKVQPLLDAEDDPELFRQLADTFIYHGRVWDRYVAPEKSALSRRKVGICLFWDKWRDERATWKAMAKELVAHGEPELSDRTLKSYCSSELNLVRDW